MLKLAYCTNFWSHHQAPICRQLVQLLGEGNFHMCLFGPAEDERARMGWDTSAPQEHWVVGPPRTTGDRRLLRDIVMDADVSVMGSSPHRLQAARARTGRLTLIMSERMWKEPFCLTSLLRPMTVFTLCRYRALANRPNVHYLAMGAYAADDARLVRAYGERLWSWAYFASIAQKPPARQADEPAEILWVGRMLDWKRVDVLLRATAIVCNEPGFGRARIVGTGPEEGSIRELVRTLGIEDRIVFSHSVPADEVRQLMRNAHIYVLPSDRNEGWGVAANEAMSEGAVLVASREAGSAPELIRDGVNGFLFDTGNVQQLANILVRLIRQRELRERVRQQAWRDISSMWSPRVGAERLLSLCQSLLNNEPAPSYASGPCRYLGKGVRGTVALS